MEDPEDVAARVTCFLRAVFEARNYIRVHLCSGKYSLEEMVSLSNLWNFDEKPMKFETPVELLPKSANPIGAEPALAPGAGKGRAQYTLGACTCADGSMTSPMMIFSGVTQPTGGPMQTVEFEDNLGRKVTFQIFVAYTDTHFNNALLCGEYLKACVFPSFPVHDCCDDAKCQTTLFFDDAAVLHWTETVRKAFAEQPHVRHFLVPDTKLVQPNVINLHSSKLLISPCMIGLKHFQTNR